MKPVCVHHIISLKPHNPLRHVSGRILYRRDPSPEKLRHLPEVTQLGHSRVRLLTDQRGKAREEGAGNSWVIECAPHPLAPYHFSACCQAGSTQCGLELAPLHPGALKGAEGRWSIRSPAPSSLSLPEPHHPRGPPAVLLRPWLHPVITCSRTYPVFPVPLPHPCFRFLRASPQDLLLGSSKPGSPWSQSGVVLPLGTSGKVWGHS